MLPIAGRTAGPVGLIFFCGHSWVAGGCYRLKKSKKNSQHFFFIFPRATPGSSASYKYK